jgi:hypothetical protein
VLMTAPVWSNNAFVRTAAQQEESAYVNLVTLTQAGAVYAGNRPLEISADVNVSAWADHLTTLARIRTLNVNWDGEESVPPSFPVWSRASVFLNVLRERESAFPPTKIAVSPDGLIAFEWYGNDVFMRAEVGDTNQVEWMFSIPGSPTEFQTEFVAEITAPEQGQVWQPAEVDAPAYASAR